MSNILFFFGKVAMDQEILTQEQVMEALEVQANLQKVGYNEPLGEICIKLGFLTEEQVETILALQKQEMNVKTHLYGRIALSNELVTPGQIEECLNLQKKNGAYAPIGHYLLEKKYLSLKDHQAVLKTIQRITNPPKEGEKPPTPSLEISEEQKKRNLQYGKIALERGLVTSDQLRKGEYQRSMEKIWDYLLEKKYLSFRDHYFVLATLEKMEKSQLESLSIESKKKSSQKKGSRFQPAGRTDCLSAIAKKGNSHATRAYSWSPAMSDTSVISFVSKLDSKQANLIPGYILTEKLGYGGMAVVYKGIHKRTKAKVAIKILPPVDVAMDIFDSDMVQDEQRNARFLREAHLLRLLRHPNIIALADMGDYKGYFYYVMEYVRGITLSELLDEMVCLDEPWALEIVKKVAGALGYSWKHRVVHRDIKPENIMITPKGEIKVFDFGLAKCTLPHLMDSNLTSHDVILGTPTYMAPEQTGLLKNREIDVRTDIYSLGVTLYDMLVGMPPYYDESPLKLMVMHFKEAVPLASDHRSEISTATSKLIQKMMAKDPDKRFSHPGEVEDAIDAILQGECS